MIRVWCNGVFDNGLHSAHIELLKYAASLGDCLVVGIDCDARVAMNKGIDRPIWDQNKRAASLLQTGLVWEVKVFRTEKELKQKIKEYKPDIFVIGSDYKGKKIVGKRYAKELIFFQRIPNISTTEILNKK